MKSKEKKKRKKKTKDKDERRKILARKEQNNKIQKNELLVR